MRRSARNSLAVLMIMSTAIVGHASNSRTLDILGLRLGMGEPQVDALLQRQGVPASRIIRTGGLCQEHPGCDVTITAPTPDGELTISLMSNDRDPEAALAVAQINYTLRGTKMGEHEMIRSSMLQRFGLPNQANPMTWCHSVTANGNCRPDYPSLSFSPDSLTLILKAGSRDGVAR